MLSKREGNYVLDRYKIPGERYRFSRNADDSSVLLAQMRVKPHCANHELQQRRKTIIFA